MKKLVQMDELTAKVLVKYARLRLGCPPAQSCPSPVMDCESCWSDWEANTLNTVSPVTAKSLAVLFHDSYETLAPHYGYETQKSTRTFDAQSPNGKLMIAVSELVLSYLGFQSESI